ncbi:MAG: SDR family oxidoreductase [Bacilli bacterium]
MTNRFTGQLALVTAASKGLGKAIAKQLAFEGAQVIIASRNEYNLNQTCIELDQVGGCKPVAINADLSNPESVNTMYSKIKKQFGKLDIVVIITGDPPTGSFSQLDNDMWERAFYHQLLSTVNLARGAYPLFKEAGGGRLLTVASSSLKASIPGFMLSNTIRASVAEFVKSLSVEWAKDGILVNTIFPSRSALDRSSSEEFAKAMMYFISDENTYMTGSTVTIDGGMVKV